MRQALATVALAAAAVGGTAPSASAACYGVRELTRVCYSGDPKPTVTERTYCVYTGGDTCEDVAVPWVEPGSIDGLVVCSDDQCLKVL